MRLSTKGRYGLRALVDLALNAREEHVPLYSIAERQGISIQYLEHVFSALRKAGIVKSVKGPRGGYSLSEPAGQILIGPVLEVLEGSHSILKDLQQDEEAPGPIERAVRQRLWKPVDEAVAGILDTTTLEDLAEEARRLDAATQPMYFI